MKMGKGAMAFDAIQEILVSMSGHAYCDKSVKRTTYGK